MIEIGCYLLPFCIWFKHLIEINTNHLAYFFCIHRTIVSSVLVIVTLFPPLPGGARRSKPDYTGGAPETRKEKGKGGYRSPRLGASRKANEPRAPGPRILQGGPRKAGKLLNNLLSEAIIISKMFNVNMIDIIFLRFVEYA